MKHVLVGFLAVVVLTLAACKGGDKLTGQPAPGFTLSDADGSEISLGDYKGRPVVLYFFASW
jgi:peroxiredoxin Q/BCP